MKYNMENIPYELIARYLAGECNDNEKQQVLEWKLQNPEMMDEFTKMWAEIPSNEFTPDQELALQKVKYRISTQKEKKAKRLPLFVGGIAAAVAIVFILINVIIKETQDNTLQSNDTSWLTLSTDTDEIEEYLLPDGSKVWLNQSSSIQYPQVFEGNTREIHLEGEAFFEIAPNADKPFIIHANNTQTRVVGTSFGVKARKDNSEVIVTVSTGIINFSAEGETDHIQLVKGEQGICNPKERILEKNTSPDPNLLAWKTKILIFEQSSLTQVSKLLEEVYHTPVTVDNSVADLRITSTFDQMSLSEILQIIELTLNIHAEETPDGIMLK